MCAYFEVFHCVAMFFQSLHVFSGIGMRQSFLAPSSRFTLYPPFVAEHKSPNKNEGACIKIYTTEHTIYMPHHRICWMSALKRVPSIHKKDSQKDAVP